MLFRPLAAALLLASSISAWPIIFYPTQDCHSHPIAILHEPSPPGKCGFFPEDAKSYSGGTADTIQKVLLYYEAEICHKDAAHRSHSNHTINNSRNKCIPFKKNNEHPRAYVFIEEFLGNKTATFDNEDSACNALRIQS